MNVWHIRMMALTLLILFIGVGSQTLVDTFAANTVQPAINASLTMQNQIVLPATHCLVNGQWVTPGRFVDTAHPHYTFNAHC